MRIEIYYLYNKLLCYYLGNVGIDNQWLNCFGLKINEDSAII